MRRTGIIPYQKITARVRLTNEMPIETKKTIGAITLRNVIDLISDSFMLLSMRRWLWLAYIQIRVIKMPAAA